MSETSEARVLSEPTARDHIICVDDEEGILNALRQQLAPFEDTCDIDLALNAREALDLLEELDEEGESIAMVIADQIMPGMKGAELLERVHDRYPQTIKILLTGQAGLDAVVYAINCAGLDRYIAKPWDEPDLRLTVETLLTKYRLTRDNQRLFSDLKQANAELRKLNSSLERRVRRRTAELQAVNERLSELAITDGLTGRFNHRYFKERLRREIERTRRSSQPFALLMIDIDYFKQFNDTHGHLQGDLALRRVADVIAEGRRVNDIVARYGGEEFAVLLPNTPIDAAVRVAEQMREAVQATKLDDTDEGRSVTVSIGVAECPTHATEAAQLLQLADEALYEAKRKGRNTVVATSSSTGN